MINRLRSLRIFIFSVIKSLMRVMARWKPLRIFVVRIFGGRRSPIINRARVFLFGRPAFVLKGCATSIPLGRNARQIRAQLLLAREHATKRR